MKKFFALVLALALTMGLCAVSLPASADDKPVELNVWILGPGDQADQPEVFALFNEKLHETLPNISANIEIIAGDYKDAFSRAMAAEEQLDLAWMGWHHNISEEAINGTIQPLDDLLEKYGQGIIEKLTPTVIDIHRQADGKIYNLISWQGLVGGRSGVYLPVEAIENSGVGENWLAEAQEIAYKFQENHTVEVQQEFFDKMAEFLQGLVDNGKIYKGFTSQSYTYPGFSGNLGWLVVGDRYTDSFTVHNGNETDLAKNFYKTMAEYYDKGYIRSDIASAESNSSWIDGFDENDEVTGGHNAWTDNYDQALTQTNGIPMTLIYNRRANDYILGNATSMVIPYTAKYPEEAMMLLNEIYTNAPLYQLLIYGEEGKHYIEDNDDDHSITMLGGSNQPTSDFAYGLWCWTIGTCENVRKTQNAANDPAWYEELKELEKTAYVSPLLQFSYDKSNMEAEYANLSAIAKEYGDALTKGYLGVAGWEAHYNTYMDQLKANGLEDVIADCQAQVDAFCKDRNITSWNWKAE